MGCPICKNDPPWCDCDMREVKLKQAQAELDTLRAENEKLREASLSLVKWFREYIGENKGELDDILEALECKSYQAKEALN